MFVFLWADARGVDLQDRLASGALLTLSEVTDLDTFCGMRLRNALADSSPDAVCLRSRTRKAKKRKTKNKHGTVSLLEKRNRLAAIFSFLEFTSAEYLSRLHLQPERWKHFNSVRANCLQWLASRCKAIRKPRGDDLGAREGLDKAEVTRLRAVIEPDHEEIPFRRQVRFGNYVMIKLMLDLGIRRGELLGIRIEDCTLGGGHGTITIHRRPDDVDDPRTIQPASKTNARVLTLGGRLTDVLHEWIVHHRPKIRGARGHAFLIVASTDGQPLSLSSVNKVMAQLRTRVPGLPSELCPHVLRHTWNDDFSSEMDRKGVPENKEAKWRARLMGWRSLASSLAYLRRTTRRRAENALLEMQERLDIQHTAAQRTGT